jgi:hypothetical protein
MKRARSPRAAEESSDGGEEDLGSEDSEEESVDSSEEYDSEDDADDDEPMSDDDAKNYGLAPDLVKVMVTLRPVETPDGEEVDPITMKIMQQHELGIITALLGYQMLDRICKRDLTPMSKGKGMDVLNLLNLSLSGKEFKAAKQQFHAAFAADNRIAALYPWAKTYKHAFRESLEIVTDVPTDFMDIPAASPLAAERVRASKHMAARVELLRMFAAPRK